MNRKGKIVALIWLEKGYSSGTGILVEVTLEVHWEQKSYVPARVAQHIFYMSTLGKK